MPVDVQIPKLVLGPENASRVLFLAHGAGAPMDSAFMGTLAHGLSDRGIRVVRFEFPYMAARRTGSKRPPDRMPVLLDTFETLVRQSPKADRWFVGGKSMGGRVASMIVDKVGAHGAVCVGYPFHPPRKPGVLRTEHLAQLTTPTLIVQGTRDALGTVKEVEGYALSPSVQVAWIEGADHDFDTLKRQGVSNADVMRRVVDHIENFTGGSSPTVP